VKNLKTSYKKLITDKKLQFLDEMANIKGPALLEIQVKKGFRKSLGRPTTTPIQNKEMFMNFVKG
jgi:phosphonopyruvate decarboxylase